MATLQKCKPPTTSTTSSETLLGLVAAPTDFHQSNLFMKKLVAVTISHITYLRGLIPEYAYADRELNGLHLKVLSESSNCPAAIQIIKWLKGAFDALDKKYLQRLDLIFCVDEEKTSCALETYSLLFSHDEEYMTVTSALKENDVQSNIKISIDDIRMATIHLLRHTSLLLNSLLPVKNKLTTRMRLYYHDGTPEDYEPPWFGKASADIQMPANRWNLKNGSVATGFHRMKLRSLFDPSIIESAEITGDFTQDSDVLPQFPSRASSENIANIGKLESESVDRSTRAQMDILQTYFHVTQEHNTELEITEKNNETKSINDQADNSSAVTLRTTPTEVHEARVNCPCGVQDDGGLMIMCDSCYCWQHANCYRIIENDEIPKKFCCVFCHNSETNDKKCNDPSLLNLREEERKYVCVYRRALCMCKDTWRITKEKMQKELSVSPKLVENIITSLETQGVVKRKRKGRGNYRVVDSETLNKEILPKYIGEASLGMLVYKKDICDDEEEFESNKRQKLEE